jgi:4-amino-4-deoxychorismate lyase
VIPQHGITLRQCKTPLACHPLLAGIKHLNRLEQVLARNEWSNDAIHEGVMCSTDGEVIEGTMSNLFAVREGGLLTPDLTHCGVDGIMRRQVLAVAGQLGIPCDVVRIMPSELTAMDELFVTNSIIGIWPVACYEGHVFGEQRVTERLIKALDVFMDKVDA